MIRDLIQTIHQLVAATDQVTDLQETPIAIAAFTPGINRKWCKRTPCQYAGSQVTTVVDATYPSSFGNRVGVGAFLGCYNDCRRFHHRRRG
ncbi:hypothetical protein [Microbulbifer sp. VAAF005]|uniref:hypothetical protein n=1 Tax=Microbulbifer sp. VAAF005 TaxID=3034230 RepID=UPI0024AD7E15|nr:hypothetical protein [Microbulbifer sp. VAAF005]WHI47472.1 hypothetical protein P0078_03550 [Microbulbifer sp. VAAF005]